MKYNKIIESVSETYNFNNKNNVIFLNTGDVFNNKIINHPEFSVKKLPGQAKKSIKNNDLLYSEIRPQNKHFSLVNLNNPEDYVVSTKLMVLRLKNDNYLMKYVYYSLTNPTMLSKLQHIAEFRSGTFPQITFDEIAKLDLPEISLSEQQHIVDTI